LTLDWRLVGVGLLRLISALSAMADGSGKMITAVSEVTGRSVRLRKQLQQLSRKGDSSMQIDENQADMERRLRSLNDLKEEVIEIINAARNSRESIESESRIKRERLVLLKEKQMHTQKNVHSESQSSSQMENAIESLKNQCSAQVIQKANFLDLVKDTENQRILAQKRLESRKLDLQKQKSIAAEFEHALNHARQSRKRLMEELELVRKELESVHAKNVSLQHERSVGNTRRGIADFKREEPALLDNLASLRKDRMRLERELKEYTENLENESVKCNAEKESAVMWLNEADKASAHCAKREEAAIEDQNRLNRIKEVIEEVLRENEQLDIEYDRTENEMRVAKENLLSKQRQTKTLKQVGAHLEERLKAEHASLSALQEKRDALCEKIDKATRDTPSLRALARQEEEKRIRLVEEAQEVDLKLEEMRRRASSIILGQENGPPPGSTTLSSSRISSRPGSRPGSSHTSKPGSSAAYTNQTNNLLPKADSRIRPSTANLSAFSGSEPEFSSSQRARPSTAGGITAGGLGTSFPKAGKSGLQFAADAETLLESNRDDSPSHHWPSADYRRSQPSQSSRISSANQDWKQDDFRHSRGPSALDLSPAPQTSISNLQQESQSRLKSEHRSDHSDPYHSVNQGLNPSKLASSSLPNKEGNSLGADSYSNPARHPSSSISTSIAQQFSALQDRLDNAANFTDDLNETAPKRLSEHLSFAGNSRSSSSINESIGIKHATLMSHSSGVGLESDASSQRGSYEAQNATFLKIEEPRMGLPAAQTSSTSQQPIKVSSLKVSNELETLLKRMEAFAQDVDVDANKLSSSAARAINANRELIANSQEIHDDQRHSPSKLSSISNRLPSSSKAQAAAATPEKQSKDVDSQLQERAKALAAKTQLEKQLAEIRASQETKYRQYAQVHSYQHRTEPATNTPETATRTKSLSEASTLQDKTLPAAIMISSTAHSADELSRIREIQSAKFQEAKVKQAERLESTIVHSSSQEFDSQFGESKSGMQALSQADLDQSLNDTAAQRASLSHELDQHDARVDQKLSDSSMQSSIANTLFRGIFEACRHNKMSVSNPLLHSTSAMHLLHIHANLSSILLALGNRTLRAE
jgi:hypothetical protein